jgi:hypothetical protein
MHYIVRKLCGRYIPGMWLPQDRDELPKMKKNTGSRYEIALDGKPRSYRDSQRIAIEAGQHLKRKYPNAQIGVNDLETGDSIIIRTPPVDIRQWR